MQEAPTFVSVPNDLATCQQMIGELLTTIKELRATVDKQNAHIHYLVRMTFGRRSERYEGATLFDGCTPPAEKIRGQVPFFKGRASAFRGRPRGRMDDCKLKAFTVRSCQPGSP
jgi:hypothetical protein